MQDEGLGRGLALGSLDTRRLPTRSQQNRCQPSLPGQERALWRELDHPPASLKLRLPGQHPALFSGVAFGVHRCLDPARPSGAAQPECVPAMLGLHGTTALNPQ